MKYMSALISGRISSNTTFHLRVTAMVFMLLIDILGPARVAGVPIIHVVQAS
jgi:hypothetical protein